MDPGGSQCSSIVGNVPLSELTAWPPPQPQRVVTGLRTPHGVVLLTLEYVGDGNSNYSSLVTPSGSCVPQFSTALSNDQSVVPCIGVLDSGLGSLYDIAKSVIVTAHNDNDQNRPRQLSDLETSVSPSDSFMPPIPTSPPSVITCSTPGLSPNDLEDPTVNHLGLTEDQRPGNTVSSSVFLRPISVDDVMADPTPTSDAVPLALDGADGHNNGVMCTSPDSALNPDFPNNSSHPVSIEAESLLCDELMANANSELDRMEFVIGNPDGIGFSYTLDSNVAGVFSFRHLLEQNALAESDSDMSVRRDDALSSTGVNRRTDRPGDFHCDLLDMQPSQLDALEANNSIKEDIVPLSSASSGEECKISPPATVKPALPQHRPALAEKTFRMDNNSVNNKERSKKKSKSWNEDCSECLGGDCFRHVVQAISDKPVPSRAWASLPGAYLAVNHIFDPRSEKQVTGVFARKLIPKCTQFGPMEGVLGKGDDSDDRKLKLLVEKKNGSLVSLDMSDENTSNWMRFVRAAEDCREQNVVLSQHESSLYFTTTRDIHPRQELLVWYSQTYASRRGLKLLEPTEPWTCFKCNQVFTNSVDIQRHLNVHANEQNENDDVAQLKCDHLGQPVRKKGVLHFAMKKHKLGSERSTGSQSHQCTTCKRVFPRNYSLKRHLLMHARERKHTCLKCSVKFNNALLKDRHMRSVHNIEPTPAVNGRNELDCSERSDTWSCSYCLLVFRAPELLRIHSLVHTDETGTEIGTVDLEDFRVDTDMLRCPDCLQDFSTARELAHHASSHGKGVTRRLRRKVDPNKPFRCQRCYKSFASKERLAHHMLVHGSDESKPLQCNICAKRFLTNSALICHVKSHSGGTKLFDCPICKETFDQGMALREHVHIHSNNGYFTCPHCNKVFQGYGSTRKHIRAFHNERTQKCHHCNHMFPTVDKLRMHMLRHSDHREFLCANCGKQFKRKDKLKEHMARMHSIERETESMVKASSTNRASNRRLVAQANAPDAVPENKTLASAIAADKLKKKKKKIPPKQKEVQNLAMADYERYVFKCHPCLQGFKRRGMLVNHLAKRHPDVAPDDVPELNLPILRTTRDYFCQYCEKVYKSSSKRKAHILKNHPGADLPSDGRQKSSGRTYMFSQSVGTEPTAPHHCQWCYKQYATKAKLLQHQRSMHKELLTEPIKKTQHETKCRGKRDVQNPAVSTTSPPAKKKIDVQLETAAVVDMAAVNEFPATGVEASGVDASGVDASGVDASGVDASGVDASGVDALVVSSSDSGKDPKSGRNIVMEVIEQDGVEVSEKMLSEAMQFLAATGNLHILGNNAYPAR